MELLSITDIANRLHITRQAVFKYVKSGNLPATRQGNLWKIKEEDFKAFMKAKNCRKKKCK